MDSQAHSITGPGFRRRAMIWLTAAILYFLLASATIHLTSNGRDIAAVWPANAVLVAMLLSQESPLWLTVLSAGFVGNAVANILTRGSVSGPVLYGACNLGEVTIAVALLRDTAGCSSLLRSPAVVGRFILVAGLIAPALSGLGGAMTAWWVFNQHFQTSYTTWVLSDGLGLLIFTPFFSALFNGEYGEYVRRASWPERIEALALLLLTIAIASLVFLASRHPLLFTLFAPVMLATFRMGGLGTTMTVMAAAIIGAVGTLHDMGPVAMLAASPATQAEYFQLFLAVLLLTCLPVAASLSARGALTSHLAERERELSVRAATDSLTGLLNRAEFQARATAALQPAEHWPFSLVAIDIDHFKGVNDGWGHAAGDMALVQLATILRSQLRGRDILGRLGGDEFILALPRTSAREAEAICERIRARLRRAPLSIDGKTEILLRISCGITAVRPGQTYKEALRHADEALYLAKSAGRNTIRCVA